MSDLKFDISSLEIEGVVEPPDADVLFPLLDREIGAARALILLRVVWPRFVEYRGGVFLDFLFEPSNVDAWVAETGGDIRRVEAVVNHVHLWDLFDSSSEYVPAEALQEIANIIAHGWRGAVTSAFPTREFTVEAVDDPDEYGPTLYLTSAR